MDKLTIEGFRLALLSPSETFEQLERDLSQHTNATFSSIRSARRYEALPLIALIVDGRGLPVDAPSLFLANRAITSRGVTGDTTRTYGESLLPWLRYVYSLGKTIVTVDEETLKLYRADLMHGKTDNPAATATANLRVSVAVQFHCWCQRNGFRSPLGGYLNTRSRLDRSLAPRRIVRFPQAITLKQFLKIVRHVKPQFRLLMRWAMVCGARRFEVCNLSRSALPGVLALSTLKDEIAGIEIKRKGGYELTLFAPAKLCNDTQWYIETDRPFPAPGFEDYVFLNRDGRPISRQSFSKEFRRCADLEGCSATLHHLRHSFAVTILPVLKKIEIRNGGGNALKVLQMLLGHQDAATTEGYLRAMDVTGPEVVRGLTYLYGGTAG